MKIVPQLEEQAMQLIPPLKVSTDKAATDALAKELGLSVE